ncbi:NAD(P)/FAD-dependent oxidoreductase, partial [Klebsiella pneumoniae]|nr:NAD(P)/FAD-dependent oxidoreductase [Klebsiella pneumoniae]
NEVQARIKSLIKETPDKLVKNSLRGIIEERYLNFILEQAGVAEDTTGHHISNQQILTLAQLFKGFTFTVNGTLPIEKAFVTGGGVSIKEI